MSGAAINGLGLQNPYILLCNSLIIAQNLLSSYSSGNLNLFTTVDIFLQISVIVSISRLYHLLSTQELNCLLEPPSPDTQSPEQETDTQNEHTSSFMPPTTVQDLILTGILVAGTLTYHQPSKIHNKGPAIVKNTRTTYDEKINTPRFYPFPNTDSTHYQTPKAGDVDYLKNETFVHPFEERTKNICGKIVL